MKQLNRPLLNKLSIIQLKANTERVMNSENKAYSFLAAMLDQYGYVTT
jgi:hypothetical protein